MWHKAPPGLKSMKHFICEQIEKKRLVRKQLRFEERYDINVKRTGSRVSGGLLIFLPKLSSWNCINWTINEAKLLLDGGSACTCWKVKWTFNERSETLKWSSVGLDGVFQNIYCQRFHEAQFNDSWPGTAEKGLERKREYLRSRFYSPFYNSSATTNELHRATQ